MQTLIDSDALFYLVVAKAMLAVLLVFAGGLALIVGTRLYLAGRRNEADEAMTSGDYCVRRLKEDMWLARGTQVKARDDDPAFKRLPADGWVARGTLVQLDKAPEASRIAPQRWGVVLILSSLLWGVLAYLVSPLEVEKLKATLAQRDEHKTQAALNELRDRLADTQTRLSTVQQSQTALQNAVVGVNEALKTSLAEADKAQAQILAQILAAAQNAAKPAEVKAEIEALVHALRAHEAGAAAQFQQATANSSAAQDELRQKVSGLQGQFASFASGLDTLQELAARPALPEQAQAALNRMAEKLDTAASDQAGDQAKNAAAQDETRQKLSGLQGQLVAFATRLEALQELAARPAFPEQAQAALNRLAEKLDAALVEQNTGSANAAALQDELRQKISGLQGQFNTLSGRLDKLQELAARPAFPEQAQAALNRLLEKTDAAMAEQGELSKALASLQEQAKAPVEDATPAPEIVAELQKLPVALTELRGELNILKQAISSLQNRPANTPETAALEGLKNDVAALREALKPVAAPENSAATSQAAALVAALTDANTPVLRGLGPYLDIPLEFRPGSASELHDTTPLAAIGLALQHPALQGKAVALQVYTDNPGATTANLALSSRRAKFAREYLIKEYNLDPRLLKAEGKGEAAPIASNETEEGRAKNRRIRLAVKNSG